jgi:hypothetical protein
VELDEGEVVFEVVVLLPSAASGDGAVEGVGVGGGGGEDGGEVPVLRLCRIPGRLAPLVTS